MSVATLLAMQLPVSAQAPVPNPAKGDIIDWEYLPTVPKIEFSVGGGAGIGGYLASFPGDPWMTHVSQDPGEKDMIFYLPKSGLRLSGHAGLYVDFNFTDHWGLITGAEFGIYNSVVKSRNLLNVSSISSRIGSEFEASQVNEDWVGFHLPDFLERHRMYAVQIPLMAKYMVPIQPLNGHRFYVAAGVKLGIHVHSQYTQSWDENDYAKFAFRQFMDGDEISAYVLTAGSAESGGVKTWINPDVKLPDGARATDWLYRLKLSPIDVMASFDTGFRWNLGKGMGLYTGLYCDFGLLRPVVHQTGSKVLNLDSSKNMATSDPGEISIEGARHESILAADAPDYCYVKGDGQEGSADENVFVYNKNPFAKTLNAMQAGVKVRFAFGRVRRPVRQVREPKIKEPKAPRQPKQPVITEGPEEIQQTMIELSDALFAFDKFNLSDEAKEMLDRVVSWLSDHPELKVEIGGHTDSRGSDAYNQKLSENRAKSVYDYFVSHGIDAARLSHKGYGESRPIDTNETDEGRQRNRRVELQIIDNSVPAAE